VTGLRSMLKKSNKDDACFSALSSNDVLCVLYNHMDTLNENPQICYFKWILVKTV
jgi:hypothetical protein